MRGMFWSLRRTAMVGVAIGSVAVAAALVWMLQLATLGTALLLAILALALLPGVTFAAWWLERKHKRESVVEDNGLFEMPEGVEVVEEEPDDAPDEAPGRDVGKEPTGAEEQSRTRQVHPPHPAHRRRGVMRQAGRR